MMSLKSVREQLELWVQQGWIRSLDLAFARFLNDVLEESEQEVEPLLLLLAALTSYQTGRGHVCIELTRLLQSPQHVLAFSIEKDESLLLPNLIRPERLLENVTLAECQRVLNNAAVSNGEMQTPLVLNEQRLYLRRLWLCEQRIAKGICQRLTPVALSREEQTVLASSLELLFPDRSELDYQKLACAMMLRRRFGVITGGPGTGKTTTVVKLLAALQTLAGSARPFRIRLAAPTGKAAARLNESIRQAVQGLPLAGLPVNVPQDQIPTRVTTLHRLLGSRPDTRRFRYNRDHPLLLDVLVIDEASMVDVSLMSAVFEALPPEARLILLGDKDQLASVDAGAILGELCNQAQQGHYLQETSDALAVMTGQILPLELIDSQGHELDQSIAMLRKSYRFTEDSGIGWLARLVNAGESRSAAFNDFYNLHYPDIVWLNNLKSRETPEQIRKRLDTHIISGSPDEFQSAGRFRPVGYAYYLELMQNTPESHERSDWDEFAHRILEAFNQFQVLCALRQGEWGVEGLNERIAQVLLHKRLILKTQGWYAGRPVLITSNDYNLNLMNGDIGITFRVPWGENGQPVLRVAFPDHEDTSAIRWISPSRLQQLETVFAMTVHKSQGSEFSHVCLILPDQPSPVVTRELIYTGITRAKHRFSLITGDANVFYSGVRQKTIRLSGLEPAIRGL